jgi:hypothetical protein
MHLVAALHRIALVYTCSCIALGAFSTWYTLLDYRFSWGPVRIGAFATAFGVAIAFTQSVVIRYLGANSFFALLRCTSHEFKVAVAAVCKTSCALPALTSSIVE